MLHVGDKRIKKFGQKTLSKRCMQDTDKGGRILLNWILRKETSGCGLDSAASEEESMAGPFAHSFCFQTSFEMSRGASQERL